MKKLCFIFYTLAILKKVFWNRPYYAEPLDSVMGSWSFMFLGRPDWQVIGNVLAFIPFGFLLLWAFGSTPTCWKGLRRSAAVSFLSSLFIETCQLIFHLGTFQLSDLIYNTLGGFAGGAAYYVYVKARKKGNTK